IFSNSSELYLSWQAPKAIFLKKVPRPDQKRGQNGVKNELLKSGCRSGSEVQKRTQRSLLTLSNKSVNN
ncbi:hypothetical protein, partial [Lacticaseibacillus rhamnosus]|uniref:hypothetical protein n=1 Tax=Lacticaseibacillus rhamnosus TaxID=47715 RepID=UPI0007E17E62